MLTLNMRQIRITVMMLFFCLVSSEGSGMSQTYPETSSASKRLHSAGNYHRTSSYGSSHSESFESVAGVAQGSEVRGSGFLTEKSFIGDSSLNEKETTKNDRRSARRVLASENPTTSDVTRPPTGIKCSSCEVKGQSYKGHSRFEYRDGCFHHRCICHCDGSWDCPPTSTVDMCERENLQNPNCISCSVQERQIKGNSYFDMKDGCTLYKNCICRCNGSYECSSQRAENLCPSPLDPTEPPRVEMPVESEQIEHEETGPETCQQCYAHGRYHDGNTRFTHVDDCIEYDCDCFCSGEWQCPSERAQNICDFDDEQPSTCNECEVNGEFFEGNSYFKRKNGCTEYTCNCHCDGTYDCPLSLAKDICSSDESTTCSQCEVSETETYPGESDFAIEKECIRYQCRCNCNGSWQCPGSDARNICKGEQLGGCRNCEISENEYYPGNTNFSLTKGCIGYSCQCFCNGSWNCPGEEARDTCKGEVVGGCRSCILSDREYYPGETDFEMKRGCILYQCRCNCDGGWKCPGYKAKDVCKNPEAETTYTRQTCRECRLSEGEIYQPNTNFNMTRGCYQYNCTCSCDGTHSCPTTATGNICEVSPEQTREFRQRQEREFQRQRQREQDRMRQEQRRLAFERQRQKQESTRNIRHNSRYENAKKDRDQLERTRLQAERARILRERQEQQEQRSRMQKELRNTNRRQQTRVRDTEVTHRINNTFTPEYTQPCLKCSFAGKTHPGNTKFQYKRGCYTYNCSCDCNGRWNCDRDNVVYTCNKTRDTSYRRVSSQPRKDTPSYHISTNHRTSTRTNTAAESAKTQSTDTGVQTPRKTYPIYPQSRNNIPSTAYGTAKTDIKYDQQSSSKVQVRPATTNTNTDTQYSNTLYSVHTAQSSRQLNPVQSPRYTLPIGLPGYRIVPQHNSRDFPPLPSGYNTQTHSSTFIKYPVYPPNQNLESRQILPSQNLPSVNEPVYPSSRAGFLYPPAVDKSTNIESCQRCLADGKYYTVNDKFDMNRNCVIYRCRCMCNGNYRCAITPNPTCQTRSVDQGCGNCHVGGLIYPGNMGFQQRKGCTELTCQCRCDGTYVCPENKTVNLCPSNGPALPSNSNIQSDCAVCDIEGQSYSGNSQFKIYKQCLVYNCNCDCKGAWQCSGEHAPGCISAHGAVTVGYPDIRKSGSCSKCIVLEESYSPDSNFTLKQGCSEYKCHCNCDGTWYCPSQSPRIVCDARAIQRKASSCQSCDARGTVYPADATFVLREGCHQHTCTCNCDGTWRCPSNSTINVCESLSGFNHQSQSNTQSQSQVHRQFSQVRQPNIESKQSYLHSQQSHSQGHQFQSHVQQSQGQQSSSRQGYHTRLQGSPSRTQDHRSFSQGTCRTCAVNGKTYMANSDFKFREGCTEYDCHCFCNGTWECPAEKTKITCQSADYRIDGCKECRVKNETYPGGSPFAYREGCWEFNCMCGCDGRWNCPADRGYDLCGSVGSISSRCRPCLIESKIIKSESIFNLRQGCNEYLCDCGCDGKLNCPEDRSINTCELEGTPGVSKSDTVAKGCKIGNRTFYRRIFGYTEDCLQYTCICFDNGAWRCPSNKTKRVC